MIQKFSPTNMNLFVTSKVQITLHVKDPKLKESTNKN